MLLSRLAVDWGPVLLAWAAVGYKLRDLWCRPWDIGVRIICLVLGIIATALTFMLPPVYVWIDRLLGVPNVARLLEHSIAVVGGWYLQKLLFHLTKPRLAGIRKALSSGWFLIITLGLMVALFWAAPLDETEVVNFTSRYGDKPFMLEYRLVLLAYMGLVMYNLMRQARCYARSARHKPSVHLGMHLVSAGAALSLIYLAHKISYAVTSRFRLGYPGPDPELVSDIIRDGFVLLLVIGATMPAWGPRMGIPRLYHWIGHYIAFRRLRPLWRDLRPAEANMELLPSMGPVEDVLDVHFRLYRRLIEIRDGIQALRAYMDSRVEECARRLSTEAGLRDEDVEATVDAAVLAVALREKAKGRKAAQPLRRFSKFTGTTATSEVGYLQKVSGCYRSSPCSTQDAAGVCQRGQGISGWAKMIEEASQTTLMDHSRESRRKIARVITELLSPINVVSVLLITVALRYSPDTASAVAWGLTAALFASILPLLYIVRKLRRRKLTDYHVRAREQRPLIGVFIIASVTMGFVLLTFLGAPRELVALVGAMVAGMLSLLVVTLFWKISAHVAVSAGTVVILTLVFGWKMLIFAPVVALSAWSRVVLRDHTLAQTAAGAVLGSLVAGVVFVVLR